MYRLCSKHLTMSIDHLTIDLCFRLVQRGLPFILCLVPSQLLRMYQLDLRNRRQQRVLHGERYCRLPLPSLGILVYLCHRFLSLCQYLLRYCHWRLHRDMYLVSISQQRRQLLQRYLRFDLLSWV